MKKLWGGRFKKKLDASARDFSYSLAVDKELLPYDIQVNIAHVKTLAKAKILKQQEATRLVNGLQWVRKHLMTSDLSSFVAEAEDVHTLIQCTLEKKIGVLARKLHTARSRNDQVATTTRLYLKDKIHGLIEKLTVYQKALLVLALKGENVAIPGYTHLQRAQLVLFAHHMLAYVEMAERDKERLQSACARIDELPLGAGALAGVSFPLDRKYTAKLLEFAKVSDNSIDAVSARDYIVEILSDIAILFMHISRLCEDCILWSSQEFGFISIPEDFATGSSVMPHKKNPDMFELARGKTGQVYGNLISLLVTMKGLPLSYNRDMQEDKAPLFSSLSVAHKTLEVLSKMLPKVDIKENQCLIASSDSFLLATDLMDHMVRNGVALQDAHICVGQIVLHALERGKDLSSLSLEELRAYSDVFEDDPADIFDSKGSLRKRQSHGSTHPTMVKRMLQQWQKRLNKK